ncbi:MAG: FAD-binding oxidoreductase [Burkholderiaceae bacterium]
MNQGTSREAVLDHLRELLGAVGVLVGPQAERYGIDTRETFGARPVAVVRPESTEQVAAVVRVCAQAGLPMVAQGGNTSLSGGSVPRSENSCIVLSLSRMNRVLAVDPLRFTVTAEAGCVIQSIHAAVEAVDRLLSLEWGAIGSASLGGAISTNAGGLNVLRYGNTREQVLGLEVVLADGTIWNGLRSLRKDASGYDLKHMFIGAEGTLGIITKAVLRLHPRPRHAQSMFASLPQLHRLPQVFALARDVCGDNLSAFELIHGGMVDRIVDTQSALSFPLTERSPWYILMKVGGSGPVESQLEAFYEAGLRDGFLGEAIATQSVQQENAIWAIRHEMIPFRYLRGRMVKWDASVPLDVIPEFLDQVVRAVGEIDPLAQVIAFGHVGDGNLHMSAWPRCDVDPEVLEQVVMRITAAVDNLIWAFSGSICAEHGVGVENLLRLRGQKSDVEVRLMRALKSTLDPANLLNPGVLLLPGLADE